MMMNASRGFNISSVLPQPVRRGSRWQDDESDEEEDSGRTQAAHKQKAVPPQGKRAGWVPRALEDFGDGGAFPEIHVAQYPLDMGRKTDKKSSGVVALQMDSEGNIKYDAILNQDRTHRKIVQSTAKDLVAKKFSELDKDKPDQEEVIAKMQETQAALEKVINGKITAAKVARPEINQKKEAEYIRYTPSQAGGNFNSGAKERIIKMHEMPVDPLEPPKFRHKKAPRGPPSPPVPVMHSPPKKISQKDMQDWKIPPCVSNWKNAKGYTIPLDKRLAADGRGHSQVVINDKFAQFSESLIMAQELAREGITARIKERERQQRIEKEKKDEELRQLARDARMMRTGAAPINALGGSGGDAVGGGGGGGGDIGGGGDMDRDDRERSESPPRAAAMPDTFERETKEERDARRQRDEIREDRRRERERERRLEELERKGAKKSRLTRDRDRDVSEKVALGLAQPSGQDMQFDQRLFNQTAGMDSGFGAEDGYGLYDKPLFQASASSTIYRPKASDAGMQGEGDAVESALKNARFKVDNEFSGAGGDAGARQSRSGPVEYEKDDVFGLDDFMQQAKSKQGGGGGRDKDKDRERDRDRDGDRDRDRKRDRSRSRSRSRDRDRRHR